MTAPIRRATSLRPGQFKHLIRVASVTGRLSERDVMLLWLTLFHKLDPWVESLNNKKIDR